MKIRFFLWQLLAALAVFFPLLVFAQTTPKEGDFWDYKLEERGFIGQSSDSLNGDFRIIFSEGALHVFTLGQESSEISGRGAEILKRLIGIHKDEQKMLDLPLEIGKTWETSYSIRLKGARNATLISANSKVEKNEQITTAAGTFETIKIVRGETWGSSGQATTIINYCSDTGSAVKYSYDSDGGGKRNASLIRTGNAKKVSVSSN